MKKLLIRPAIPPLSTEVYISEGLLKSNLFLEYCENLKGNIILVADQALKELYAMDLAKKISAELLTIPSGEKAKSLETAQSLMNELFRRGAGRDTTLMALGGGSTTDLVSFVASVYMRGLSLILIPTTLLGVVDAAIGGKTAIDTAFGKNLMGTLYHPKAIFADLDIIKTLPEKEYSHGLAEILKMGLIYDASIWELAEKNEKDPSLVDKAIQGKIAIIEKDPTEQSLRRILNFGHTLGHALETVSQYTMPHGEAVMLGCLTESYLSLCLGYLSAEAFNRIETMYSRFSFKLPRSYVRSRLLQAISHDKKKAFGKIRFVLINKIGSILPFEEAYCREVTSHELEPSLDWMERKFL